MKCPRCGTIHTEPSDDCRRCSTNLPLPRCKKCKATVDWGRSWCDRHQPEGLRDDETCPACGVVNDPEADYCSECGSPMAVITRVIETSEDDRHPHPWRVYGVETNLIGRRRELDKLEAILREVEANSEPSVAILSGAQGLGKSRLLGEFQRHLEESFSQAAVLFGVCRQDVGGSFAVLSRMLRSRLYLPDDDSEGARQRLSEAVHALVDDGAEEIARLTGELIGLDGGDQRTTSEELAPEELEHASFDAVGRLLRADARTNPVVLVLDDVHLAPEPTTRLLRHLVEEMDNSPVMFLFGQTTPDNGVVDADRADVHLELAPLSDAEVRRQITDALRLADEVPEALTEQIVDAAVGNPLAVEELLRIFMSEGIIDTRTEPWQIDHDRIDEVVLPTTIEGTVEARLAELTDDERTVLEMAACAGTIFWDGLLRCLNRLRENARTRPRAPWMLEPGDEGPDRRLAAVIESLERKDMIRAQAESRLPGQREFFFKHRLERETLHDGLSSRLRKRYHRLIAQWSERELGAELDGAASFIARHYRDAGLLRRAAKQFLGAAGDARRRFANETAIELYVEALACLTDADLDLKIRATHDLGTIYEHLGEPRQAASYFQDMARYGWLVDDRSKMGAAVNKLGRTRREQGEYDDSLQYFERALDLFRSAEDDRGIASTLDDIGKIYWIRGDQQQALEYYGAALQMRRGLDDERSIALSLSHLGSLKLSLGELDEARQFLGEALELRKRLDNPRDLASSYNDFGALCVEYEDFEGAASHFEKALELAREIGFRSLECAILNNLGEALMGLKRRNEAKQHLQRARKLASEIGQQRVLFDSLRNLAELATGDARRKKALERIDRAQEIARDLDSKSYLAIAELTRADIHAEYIFDPSLRDESIQLATAAYERAISLLRETGVEIQQAKATVNYGQFLVECEKPDEARRHLERAAELFDEVGLEDQRDEARQLLTSLQPA